MVFKSCGCEICKADLGEYTNQLIVDGFSLKEVVKYLKSQRLMIDKKTVLRHLNAYGITPSSDSVDTQVVTSEPVNIELKTFDFSKYDFDVNKPISIISYLQKLHLKIHLNQAELLLKLQNDVLQGESLDVPGDALKNIATSWKLLSEVSGINVYVNQQAAIRTVEAMGMTVLSNDEILEGEDDV